MGWQPEHDALLRDLLSSSFTYSQIATSLNAKHGTRYSRDACIGRAHRLAKVDGTIRPVRPPPMGVKLRKRLENDRRREERWAAKPWLKERYQQPKQLKANREIMLAGGATKTSPAYRKHMPRQREMSKTELRTMLRTAIQNTADMGTPA